MSRCPRAFTFVELMVSMVVTGILLSAVATLAFAMSRASTVGDDYAETQARIRHATVYLSDLISRCSLICAAPGDDLVVWKSDDNGDGRINAKELVYIERGADHQYLRLGVPSSTDSTEIELADLSLTTTKGQHITSTKGTIISLIPDCTGVHFAFDAPPPATGMVVIGFSLEEEGRSRPYEIVATARCRAEHLLDVNPAHNDLVSTDDD